MPAHTCKIFCIQSYCGVFVEVVGNSDIDQELYKQDYEVFVTTGKPVEGGLWVQMGPELLVQLLRPALKLQGVTLLNLGTTGSLMGNFLLVVMTFISAVQLVNKLLLPVTLTQAEQNIHTVGHRQFGL